MADSQPTIAPDWYHLSFDSLYPIVYAHRTVEAARGDVDFSVRQTPIMPGDAVLDLCCGNGRHMIHLLELAGRVVGLDYSPDLLAIARETLEPRGLLVRADMREQPFFECFDVVVNYFTSFGYFASEEENLAAVQGLTAALKPGGRFFIDYVNPSYTVKNLEANSVRFHDGFEIREDRWIDEEKRRLNKATEVLRDGALVSRSGESVRLYAQDEFERLLAAGGLSVEMIYGDYEGSPCCDPTNPRMIAIGRKG